MQDKFGAAAVSASPHAWPSGLVRLSLLLARSPLAARHQLFELLRTRPPLPEAALLEQAFTLALAVIEKTATVLAAAFDFNLELLLRFVEPGTGGRELVSPRARVRRLDRIWGGPPLCCIEALDDIQLLWPGPLHGMALALTRGVRVRIAEVTPQEFVSVAPGCELWLQPGAVMLLRRPPLATLLLATREAGIRFADVLDHLCHKEVHAQTPGGDLSVDTVARAASVNGRQVSLTTAETRALALLARREGTAVTRQEMIHAAGVRQARALDRLILSLRDKLGDGVITTVYGTGYALQARPRSVPPAGSS